MKICSSDMNPLLRPARPQCAAKVRRGVSTVERSQQLTRGTLQALSRWGHLRAADLAPLLWPSATYGEQLSQRLLVRLQGEQLILARGNATGGTSYVLTRRGARVAESMGFAARHGLDLSSVAGSTFIHRSLATRFGIELETRGNRCLGENEFSSNTHVLTSSLIARQFSKLPDVIVTGGQGTTSEFNVTWCEVESAAKARAEIERCLKIAEHIGQRFTGTAYRLHRLLFVCDGRFNHEERIARIARTFWAGRSVAQIRELFQRVCFVRAELGPRARWRGLGPECTLQEKI